MALQISNKRVVEFYKRHSMVSFEEVNVFMVDILEKMIKDNSPSLLQEMNKTILSLQTKMDTMSSDVSKLQNETQTNLSLKMMEMKDQYVEQLKMALTSNLSDKIQPLLKENTSTFMDKTQLILNDILPKKEETTKLFIKDKIEELNETILKDLTQYNPDKMTEFIHNLETKISNSLQETHDKLNEQKQTQENEFKKITELTSTNQTNMSLILNKMENSSCKGKLSENILFNLLQSMYPTACIDSVGTQKETGDVMFTRKNNPTILIENKNWDQNVLQSEVQKFIRDCETQKCSGLFLSQNCGICNKDHFQIDIHDGNVLIYIHNVNYDKDIIKTGIDIIDHFKVNLDKLNDKVDVNTIKKDVLDSIHKEYNNYRVQKETMQKMIKDTQGKLLKQVEELKLPDLEKYLSIYYSFSSSKFTCQYCGFVSEKKAGLSAHERGCKVKKELENN